jgi:hypothetical protein
MALASFHDLVKVSHGGNAVDFASAARMKQCDEYSTPSFAAILPDCAMGVKHRSVYGRSVNTQAR